MATLIERPEDAAVSGYAAVDTVRGVLQDIQPVDSKFGGTQIKVTLKEAQILKMFEGADPFELKDGTFTAFIKYTDANSTKPKKNSAYIVNWCASAQEAYGKIPSELVGTVVTLQRQIRVTGKGKDEKTGEVVEFKTMDPKTGLPSSGSWCFVKEATFDSSATVEEFIKLVAGKNKSAALHALTMAPITKQFPQYKDAAKAGKLTEVLPVSLDDGGLYQRTS